MIIFLSYLCGLVKLVPLEPNFTICADLSYPIWYVFLVIYIWLYSILTGGRRVCITRCYIWLDYIELSNWFNQFEMLVSILIHEITLKHVLFYRKTVLIEYHINIESNIRSSQYIYTDVINYMKLLSVVTLPSIYHGCSTWKTFWEENFILVNMNNCCCHSVRKHREIKNGRQYIALDISLKFGNMENIKIMSSEPKDY